MRRPALVLAAVVLLAGPTAIAFFTGGYFDAPRAAATAVAWALVLLLAVAGPVPFPKNRPGWLAVAGLAGLSAWSAISLAWAPLIEPAVDNVQRFLLYLGVLLASIAVLRDSRLARAAEPALAAGTLVVIGYGLSGRLLPGVVELDRSLVAGGRLEQPLTYWNAEGLLAAMGFLLCVRLAGDGSRPVGMRAAAAAACAPLGAGVYLSYSRGALAVAVIGLVFLLATAPSRPQLRAAVAGLLVGSAASLAAAAFRAVAGLEGSGADQRREGAIVFGLLIALAGLAALATVRMAEAERRDEAWRGVLRHAHRLPAIATAATLACVAGLVVGGLLESGESSESAAARPSRFASISSQRYEYWRVAGGAFLESPIQGEGSGGFRVLWRQEREVDAAALEVHSLVLEMATELGLPGLALLGLFVGAVAAAGRRALRAGAPLAPGASTVCAVWLLHASIDWDWQMPAVTLPAIVLAGGLLAESERVGRPS
jgi:O-Antigen ligase